MAYVTAAYVFAGLMILGYGICTFVRFRKTVATHKALGEDSDA